MKNLLVFLFGAGCGAVGMLFYLRRDIKKQLEAMEQNIKEKNEDVPFEMKDEGEKKEKEPVPAAMNEEAKAGYDKIVSMNDYRGRAPVPVDGPVLSAERINETDWNVTEIDMDTFMHDHSNEKERLVYYRGDRVLCTENGTILSTPAEIVGVLWEQSVGKYADNTAFVRNKRLVTDYEIYVEDGLYTEEFGDENNFRED